VKQNKPTSSIVYSALEVANICGVVNQTAINWIRNDYLKAFKTPGGQYRIYPDDLVEFMRQRNMRIPPEVLANCKNLEVEKDISILLVDDDEGFNNVMARYIEKNIPGAKVSQAFNGFEAGEAMVVKRPKCLVLDLNLPGIDGIKLCRHIQGSDAFGKPVIIVVTAMQDEETERQCRELGVNHYFRKPLSFPELVSVIKSLDSN